MYIYIERDREGNLYISLSLSLYIYIVSAQVFFTSGQSSLANASATTVELYSMLSQHTALARVDAAQRSLAFFRSQLSIKALNAIPAKKWECRGRASAAGKLIGAPTCYLLAGATEFGYRNYVR